MGMGAARRACAVGNVNAAAGPARLGQRWTCDSSEGQRRGPWGSAFSLSQGFTEVSAEEGRAHVVTPAILRREEGEEERGGSMEPGCQPDTASVASGRGQKPWAERGDGATAEAAEVPACSVDAAPKRQGALANSQHAVPPLPAGSDMEVSQEESLPSSVAQATDDVRGAGESDAGCDSGSLSPSSSLQFGDSETGSSSEDNAAAAAAAAAATAAANDNGGETASRPSAAAARRGNDEDPTTPGRGSPSESSGGHRRPRRSRSESDPSAVASKKNRASGSPGKKVWLRRGPCQAQVSNAAGVAGAGGVGGGGGGGGGGGVGKRRSQQQKERLRELRRKREAAVQRKLASLPYSSSSSSSSSCSSSSSSTSRSSGGSDSDARGRVLSPAQPPLDGPPVVVYNDLSDSDSGVGKLAKKEARVASAGGEAGDQGSLALGMSTLGQDLGK
uniref:Homeotic protein female sterile-like isoform X1 n=1 Tax=Petromyzon marinus TaxID=7757 RepID=A0AAJ7TXA9_PETMA|nr:homeotic protein female sterile-like isoform X1 [Petromyzon marinus]